MTTKKELVHIGEYMVIGSIVGPDYWDPPYSKAGKVAQLYLAHETGQTIIDTHRQKINRRLSIGRRGSPTSLLL